MVLMCEGY